MDFKEFNKQVANQFQKMCNTKKLFRVNISGNDIWNLYLSYFKNDYVFRDPGSSSHNCKLCNSFIRRYGNIVSINANGKLESMFTNLGNVGEYTNSVNAINNLMCYYLI